MIFPDGRVMVLDQSHQWVEIRPVIAAQQPIQQQQKFFQASQPPVSQASIVSESVAEEVLAQPSEPELAESEPELAVSEPEQAESEPEVAETEPAMATPATKARASCPVVEEEVNNMSSPKMYFLSSQDQPEYADSESGMSSHVDLSSEKDFAPLKELAAPRASTTEVHKYIVARRVQVRTGPSAASENVCVLTPGQRVQVVKTKTSRTKTGFVTTKAYVISRDGQGWVSVNRQHKKTDEKFLFKGQAEAGFQKLVKLEAVWKRHDATVEEFEKTSANTFTIRVTCPTCKQMEALRSDLKKTRLHGRSLINRSTPELINMKRVLGKKPLVHVYDIDTDFDNSHREFKEAYDWSTQFKGSRTSFEHQVKEDLKEFNFRGVRRVNWSAGYKGTYSGFYMRDFCSVEFNSDAQLRNFVKKFEKFEFFKGAKVKVDPTYANLATVPTSSIIGSL